MSLDYIGDIPIADVETFTQQSENNQRYNEIITTIKNKAMSKRDGYTEEIIVNDSNTDNVVPKTTKVSTIKFVLDEDPLSAILPLEADCKSQDKFIFVDTEGLAGTYDCTISNNGNKINGTVEDYVISDNYGWVELTFIAPNIGFKITSSSV